MCSTLCQIGGKFGLLVYKQKYVYIYMYIIRSFFLGFSYKAQVIMSPTIIWHQKNKIKIWLNFLWWKPLKMHPNLDYITILNFSTYCVRRVNAALVIDGGRPRPRMISCHNFLVITATIPPLWTTSL